MRRARRRWPRRRTPGSRRDSASGARCGPPAPDDDHVGASCRARSLPISPSQAERRARLRAWPSTTRRAPSARPARSRTAWSIAARRISSNMSRRLLHAAPSAPSDTGPPRARSSTTGARPEPSFRFEPGQCSTLTSCSASSACSASSTQTQCAAHRRGEASPVAARYCDVVHAGPRPRPARSRRAARRRGCGRAGRRAADSGRRPRAARASTTPRSGARTRRAGGRRRRRASAPSSASALVDGHVLVGSCSRAGASGVGVHHALADGRAQAARAAISSNTDVGVVHRLHRQDRRRAAEQQLAGGQPRRCAQRGGGVRGLERPDARAQPVQQARSSASPRNSVWHRWTWVWMKPGSSSAPAASIDAVVRARRATWPSAAIRAVADRDVALRRPRSASFMVRDRARW